MLRFIEKYKRQRNVRKLIDQGILTQVSSFDQYKLMVKEAKSNACHRLFTNCYMLPDEIQRLINLKTFYSVKTDNGLAFVDDEVGYYYMFLYVDLAENLELPQLDRNTLIENVFYKDRKTSAQKQFENVIIANGYHLLSTYLSVTDNPQLPPEKYWSRLKAVEKSLADEGKRIAVPTYAQLKDFERVYRQEISIYDQKQYTEKERRKQIDAKLLHCVTDDSRAIYAIQIDGSIHTGAIASRRDCRDSIYVPALLLNACRGYYENMPEDPLQRTEYMRNKGNSGWIDVTNKAAWRLAKMVGRTSCDKSFSQFVRPGFAK